MILTNEILETNGFKSNHPENVLKKYYLHGSEDGKEFRIKVEQEYIPNTNELGFNVNISKFNTSGVVLKEGTLKNIKTLEDLNSIIELCEINVIMK